MRPVNWMLLKRSWPQNFLWAPLTGTSWYWKVKVEDITLTGRRRRVCQDCRAALDTDTSMPAGHSLIASQLRNFLEDLFETVYYAACEASCGWTARDGPHKGYAGPLASKFLLQLDLWDRKPREGRWEWAGLEGKMATHDLRKSLMVAPTPTANTAQI